MAKKADKKIVPMTLDKRTGKIRPATVKEVLKIMNGKP